MKRNISTRLLLTFVFGVLFSLILTVGASAELIFELDGDTLYISGSGEVTEDHIDVYCDDYGSVTKFEKLVFSGGDITIGHGAFEWLKNLTTIDFGSVTAIDTFAFSGCSDLKLIDFGMVNTIGSWAFEGCDGLTTIDFGAVNTIGENSFSNCDGLTTIDFGSVTTIGNYAFFDCNCLTTLDLGSVTTIGDSAFCMCQNLTTIDISSATSIGGEAFALCDNMEKAVLGKSIEYIGEYAFGYSGENTTIKCHLGSLAHEYAKENGHPIEFFPFVINYDTTGGTGTFYDQQKHYGTDLILLSTVPKKSGYSFAGWATVEGGSVIYQPGDIFSEEKDTTLYAVWSPDEYTVKFNGNGGTAVPSAQTKYHGTDLTLSYTVPVRTGYVFKGWATTASAPATYQPGDKYKNNFGATLYAVWEAATYTVKYNANGGSGVMSSSEHTYNVEASLSENAYYRTGYQFLGWATSSSATVAEYKNGETVKNLTATDGKVVNLYAVWDYAYEIGDGYVKIEFSNIDPQNYASLQDFTITKDFIKDGKNTVKLEGITDNGYKTFKTRFDSIGNIVDLGLYKYALLECYMESSSSSSRNFSLIFLGIGDNDKTYNFGCKNTLSSGTWENILFDLNDKEMELSGASEYLGEAAVGGQINKDDVIYISSITFYEKSPADKITYNVTYNANGGSGAPSAQTKNYGTALTLSTTVPTRTGHFFLGWATSSNAVSATYEAGDSYTDDADVTLYAVWNRNLYYVNYNANGGNGTMSRTVHTYGISKELALNEFTRAGYDFLGWSKSSTATTATYTNGQSVSNLSAVLGSTVNLYAVWRIKSYTVSYNANGGSGAPSSQTKYYGTNLILSTTVPTRSGYTFAGWSKTSSGSASYQPGGVYEINGSVTLYAVWTPKTYTVSYNANGGTGAPASQTKRHGTNLTLSSAIPTREGYEFNGWAISSTGYTMYLAGGTYSSNSSVTLYAVWSEIEKYTVSYDANGGNGAPASHSQETGKTTAVSSSVPTRNGYIFKGWSVVKDGAVRYNSGDTYSGNADITLYAVWEKVIDPDAPIITVEKVTTVAGATVTVEVEIANNPGIWGLNAVVAFDNTVLTLTDVACGDVFEGTEFVESTIGNSTYILSFECSDFNNTELNGVLATLEFTVSKDAETGVYPIAVTYSEGDIINSDEEIVGFELANGEVEVIDVIYGDVNGDGDVNKLDSLRLKKHLAGLGVEINEAAADVNADGAVNKLDSLRLKKHLAGLDVVLGK